MKKLLPYLLGGIVLIAILWFILGGRKNNTPKRVSTFITLSERDKSPYGAYVFYNSLTRFFPDAKINTQTEDVYNGNFENEDEKGKLFVVLSNEFEISTYELDQLMRFVEQGNNVFISAFDIGYDLRKIIQAKTGSNHHDVYPFGNKGPFSMKQTLQAPVFATQTFSYPGQLAEGYFYEIDSTIARSLARGNNDLVNFIQLRRGTGNLFIHLSPITFSNYFLLYNDNHKYFEQVFSLLPRDTKTIIWEDHYSERTGGDGRRRRPQPPNWFSSVMQDPSFRAGILTALFLLLMYAIMEMRRRQRVIPVIKPPVNDSLEFVKTIGLLYYQRRDHQNLAQKMSAYFLEHVRYRYKIFSKEMNADFIKEVSYKSGTSEELVSNIVKDIKRISDNERISDTELITLQKNIESFYESE